MYIVLIWMLENNAFTVYGPFPSDIMANKYMIYKLGTITQPCKGNVLLMNAPTQLTD